MNAFSKLILKLSFGILLGISAGSVARSQSALSEAGIGDDDQFLVELEAYVKYGGNIDVIDGMTRQKYTRDNPVVKAIHSNLPKIMGGLHKKLLDLEAKHMNYQMSEGISHAQKLGGLAKLFGIKGFRLESDTWLRKERTILARLRDKPFFKIKEIVVWEEDELSAIALRGNERGKNLRFNGETDSWERRVLTEWEVNIRSKNRFKRVNKWQGLNLDTNRGFHISDTLPGNVYTSAFREVNVYYPIIVSRDEDPEEQIQRLQRQIVKNLSYLYDPFSWAARRNTRFRTKYASGLTNHMRKMSYRVHDREWFDPVICHFLNDMVTVEMYGLEEVYNLFGTQRWENSRYLLGESMDPLNWHEEEDRPSSSGPRNPKVNLKFDRPDGARFVMLDMYLRHGYAFAENLRGKLTNLKKKEDPKAIIRQAIEEVSGIQADTYIQAALDAQSKSVIQYWKKSQGLEH